MRRTWPRWLFAAAAGSLAGSPAAAQIDYRNPDHGRPGRVTDAYPIERYAFEVSVPYRWGPGGDRHGLGVELDYGVARNIMIGLGGAWATRKDARGSRAEVAAAALWNLRRETPAGPAVSVGLDLEAPIGGTGPGGEPVIGPALLATRSVGRSRWHLNGRIGVTGGGPRWMAGVGWDLTWYRTSTLLAVDLLAERGPQGDPTWSIGVGARRQLTPTLVGFVGLAQAVDRGEGIRLTAGLSHSFAIAALMPGGGR